VSQTKGRPVTQLSTPESSPPLPSAIIVTPETLFNEYVAFRSEWWAAKRANLPRETKVQDLPREPDIEAEATAFVRNLAVILEQSARTESVFSQEDTSERPHAQEEMKFRIHNP
jgi:hypothetical protein